MSWLKNHVVLIVSCLAVIASIFWGVAEGGYEPWIVATFGVVGIVVNHDRLLVTDRKKRNLVPAQKIAARDKWRPVFEEYFLKRARDNNRGDAIIHDLDRLDTYPNDGDEKDISSWFRLGLMGTYHRGILLGLRWTYVEEDDGKWIENQINKSESAVKVMLLAEVPFESIESVNFDGDDYYNKPHIYCHFEYRNTPYERFFYGEEFQLDPGFPHHYREIAEYKIQPRFRWKFWKRSGAD